jgi:hypothetical protein
MTQQVAYSCDWESKVENFKLSWEIKVKVEKPQGKRIKYVAPFDSDYDYEHDECSTFRRMSTEERRNRRRTKIYQVGIASLTC